MKQLAANILNLAWWSVILFIYLFIVYIKVDKKFLSIKRGHTKVICELNFSYMLDFCIQMKIESA